MTKRNWKKSNQHIRFCHVFPNTLLKYLENITTKLEYINKNQSQVHTITNHWVDNHEEVEAKVYASQPDRDHPCGRAWFFIAGVGNDASLCQGLVCVFTT